MHPVNGANCVDLGSRSLEPGNDIKFDTVPDPRSEERLMPNHAVANHEVAGDQAAHASLPSPGRGDIIDISDG